MPFSFIAKKEDILKILTDEREKARIVAQTEIDALDDLDRLKIDCGVELPTTIEAFRVWDDDGQTNEILGNIIAPDRYYVCVCQTMTLAILAHEEVKKLNTQVCLRYKKFLGQPFTKEEAAEYIPFEMQDLNEMLRYIYIWSVRYSVKLREGYTANYDEFENQFAEAKVMEYVKLKNYDKYIGRVRELYTKQVCAYREWLGNTLYNHTNILVDNMKALNKVMNYEPLHPYNSSDNMREPLGSVDDDEYYQAYCNKIEQEYLELALKRRMEVKTKGREL